MNDDEVRIVIARLESMPSTLKVHIGSFGSLDKWELIKHVKANDDLGEVIVKAYMDNIRSFKEMSG